MNKYRISIFISILFLPFCSANISAADCNGQINFRDKTQICYEETIHISDLIYLNEGCSFSDYSSLLVSIRESDGSNYYLYNGTPSESTILDFMSSELKSVDSYSSTAITISFGLFLKDNTKAEVFQHNYQFVRALDPLMQLPESVNPIDKDGIPMAFIPLSDIVGSGVAREAEITCATIDIGFISEKVWNLHKLESSLNLWNKDHTFNIEAPKYMGCGTATTLKLTTKLIPEIEFIIGPEAIKDKESVDLSNYVIHPKPHTFSNIEYSEEFICLKYPKAIIGNILYPNMISGTMSSVKIIYQYKQSTLDGVYNHILSRFYLPWNGPFISIKTEANQFFCKGDTLQFDIEKIPTASSYYWAFNGDTLFNKSPYTINNISSTESLSFIETRDDNCKITQKIEIVLDSVIANFNISNSEIKAGEHAIFNSTSINAQDFLWTFDEGDISTAENPSHYFYNTGFQNVSLEVTSINGCTDTYTKMGAINVNASLGLNTNNNDTPLNIWPNPSTDYLYFTSSNNTIQNITIYNLTGKSIKAIQNLSDTGIIDISNLIPGIYFLKVIYPTEAYTIKFIKE